MPANHKSSKATGQAYLPTLPNWSLRQRYVGCMLLTRRLTFPLASPTHYCTSIEAFLLPLTLPFLCLSPRSNLPHLYLLFFSPLSLLNPFATPFLLFASSRQSSLALLPLPAMHFSAPRLFSQEQPTARHPLLPIHHCLNRLCYSILLALLKHHSSECSTQHSNAPGTPYQLRHSAPHHPAMSPPLPRGPLPIPISCLVPYQLPAHSCSITSEQN